jgi:hypothetical protein
MCERGSSPSASLTGRPGSARRGWSGPAVSQARIRVCPMAASYCWTTLAGMRPPAAERDAPVFGPGPDVRAALSAGGSSLRPVPLSSARLAGVLDARGELLAESASVDGVQVDLVVGASDPGPHRLICGGRPQDRLRGRRLSSLPSLVSMPVMGYRSPALPRSRSTRRSPPLCQFGEPNGEPMPAGVRPRQATTSHSFPS